MEHKLKLQDATKQELIQYFFGTEGFGGGFRVHADVDRFLIWLERKRTDTLLDSQETAAEASHKAIEEYVDYVRQANAEPEIDKKFALFEKANEAYRRHEEFDRQYDLLNTKINKLMGI